MADGAVQAILEALGHFIASEVTWRAGLPDDIRVITDAQKQISAFMGNADMRAEEDGSVKQLVNKVRQLAYEMEDAIEEYKLSSILGKRRLAHTIVLLRERATAIHYDIANRSEHNFDRQGSTETQVISASPVIQESELVAAKAPKSDLIELLGLWKMDLKRETIAVLGMRGVGKTTIVGSVYNDGLVKDYFPIRAWIAVSPTSTFDDLLKRMMDQFYEGEQEIAKLQQASSSTSSRSNGLDTNNVRSISFPQGTSLHELVRKYLEHKRYMVVFDDVREEPVKLAEHVKRVLPANEGSKIIMTTRYENMASAWMDKSTHGPYKLVPLARKDAWKLFCDIAFRNDNGECPQGLKEIAEGFVERCEGLPLAIMGIALILLDKGNDLRKWEKVYDNTGYYLQKNPHLTGIYKTLNRDYHELKDYLKPCFLYFGLFPKAYTIKPTRLICLWIAEGFVRENGNLTLEEIAEEYLNELIQMFLVLVVCMDPTGKPKGLRVHDFVHEIILYKVEELSFCQIVSKNVSSVVENPRRLSIHKDHRDSADEVLRRIHRSKISKIRSLYLFDQVPEICLNDLSKKLLNKVHLLKVLDLCNAPINILSDAIGSLLNLRYLSLRNTRVKKLPSTIGHLQDLQTLDLKQTKIHELPREICKLQKLRHLLAYAYTDDLDFSHHTRKVKGIKMPKEALGNFRELQKLAFVDVDRTDGCTKELVHLKALRRLGIARLSKASDGKDICDAIEGMRHLQSLSVFTTYKYDNINILESMKYPPPTLKYLYLSGCLRSLPECILRFQSLIKVRLRWSNLERNPFEILQKLPNLLELQLLSAYAGTNMYIEHVGFQKLKVLHLLDLRNLQSLYIRELALPLLEEMSIGECPNLSMPTGIKYLSKLKILNFYSMPEFFHTDTQPGGRHGTIISHVRDIFFYVKCQNGKWQTNNM